MTRSFSSFFFLFILCLGPYKSYCIRPNTVSSNSHKHIVTDWQALARPTVHNPVNAFYRFSYIDGNYQFELKISSGGVPFVVAKYALLELTLENSDIISLYNENYERSCKGCGSRSIEENIQGVALTFPMDKDVVETLKGSFLSHIRLHLADNVLGSPINLRRSETFMEELEDFRCLVLAESGR